MSSTDCEGDFVPELSDVDDDASGSKNFLDQVELDQVERYDLSGYLFHVTSCDFLWTGLANILPPGNNLPSSYLPSSYPWYLSYDETCWTFPNFILFHVCQWLCNL